MGLAQEEENKGRKFKAGGWGMATADVTMPLSAQAPGPPEVAEGMASGASKKTIWEVESRTRGTFADQN